MLIWRMVTNERPVAQKGHMAVGEECYTGVQGEAFWKQTRVGVCRCWEQARQRGMHRSLAQDETCAIQEPNQASSLELRNRWGRGSRGCWAGPWNYERTHFSSLEFTELQQKLRHCG